MTAWIPFLSLVVLMCTGMGEAAKPHCLCSQVHHPQDIFCTSNFAYRVRIHSANFALTPGLPYKKMLFYPYWKYEAEIVETFKVAPHMQNLEEGDMAEFYTPTISLCGKTALYDKGQYDYLFTGYVAQTNSGYDYAEITICTWVEHWSSVTTEQKTGLRGGYSDCNCTIFPAIGGLRQGKPPTEKFEMNGCLFNPVSAELLGVIDCEQLHGFCVFNEQENACSWENSGVYRECFESRHLKLSQTGKPAVMSRQDCGAYRGRKRKQCVLKFLKSRHRGT